MESASVTPLIVAAESRRRSLKYLRAGSLAVTTDNRAAFVSIAYADLTNTCQHVMLSSADINALILSEMSKTVPCFVFVRGKISLRLQRGATPPPQFSPMQAFFVWLKRANSFRQSSWEGVAMQLCLLWQKVNINFHQWGKFTHMILFVLHY